jgi:hypothetical protein
MPANPHWARWIFASVATYLKQVAEEQQVPALVEGLDTRTNEFMEATDRVEIRITGPFTRELSRGYFDVRLEVNVMISSRFDGPEKNRYTFTDIAGAFHQAMDGAIAVYKFGNQPGDDEHALVGCLSPMSGRNDAVRVLHFGQVNTTDGLRQSMVDARYAMEIYDNETT